MEGPMSALYNAIQQVERRRQREAEALRLKGGEHVGEGPGALHMVQVFLPRKAGDPYFYACACLCPECWATDGRGCICTECACKNPNFPAPATRHNLRHAHATLTRYGMLHTTLAMESLLTSEVGEAEHIPSWVPARQMQDEEWEARKRNAGE